MSICTLLATSLTLKVFLLLYNNVPGQCRSIFYPF